MFEGAWPHVETGPGSITGVNQDQEIRVSVITELGGPEEDDEAAAGPGLDECHLGVIIHHS